MQELSDVTRGNILHKLLCELGCGIFRKLDMIDFLKRIWDLDNMPSTDRRVKSASEDICQHIEINSDWDIDYLLITYLKLQHCEMSIFIKFLEEIVHPIVRDEDEQLKIINEIDNYLVRDGYKYEKVSEISGYGVYKVRHINEGVNEKIKNLIFSADGPKLEIVIEDALTNNIRIVKNQDYCLVYDKPISINGLTWNEMAEWWKDKNQLDKEKIEDIFNSLYTRLRSSLNGIERQFFYYYYDIYYPILKEKLPALIPQVYLHYDPYTLKQLKGKKE